MKLSDANPAGLLTVNLDKEGAGGVLGGLAGQASAKGSPLFAGSE